MTEAMVLLAIGVAALGEWPKPKPLFRLASAAVFLAIGITADDNLVLVAMIGVSIAQTARTFLGGIADDV